MSTDFVAPFTLAYTYKRTTGPIIGRFLGALGEGLILGARTAAGDVIVPASEYDPRTGTATEALVPVGPEGVIVSWSWVPEPLPTDPSQQPFAWALILLDGAAIPWLHVVLGPEAGVRTGARVVARFAAAPTGSVRDVVGFEVLP